jgi:MFS family permease
LLGMVGVGLGTMYPITTVVMQNIVPLHQLGTATGTLNFFRQLGGAIIVAVFGAIVLSGADAVGQALTLDRHGSAAAVLAGDFVTVFRWVFIAAAACLAGAFAAVLMIDERPILGRESRVPISTEPPTSP